ncbi:MAG TPA: hypothetical protein VIE16_06465 [Phenylobacterium sp.]
MKPQTPAAQMMKTKHPYAVPTRLPPDLARVQAYWQGLLRGGATMPFADDLNITDLPDLAGRLVLIDVFGPQQRFRFAQVGQTLTKEELAGRFLDETELHRPLAFLQSQCDATVECAAPTYFRDDAVAMPYGRLLLPLWGEGRISMLLGAVDAA